jgi:hypothetical protein
MISSLTANVALGLLQQTSSGSGGINASLFAPASSGQSAVYSAASIPVALKQAEQNEAKQLAQVARQPDVQRDLERYAKVVASARSLEEVLDDPIARKVLMKANGLGDQVDYVGLAKKAMMSDPKDANSLANKLAGVNGAWLTFAKTFDIKANGMDALSPKQNGFEAKWKIEVQRGDATAEAALQIKKTASGVITATVDNIPVPVLVNGQNISLTLVWKDANAVVHTSELTGKLDGATLSGTQVTDDAATSTKWSAKLYNADAIKTVQNNYVAEKRLDMLDQQLPGLGSAVLFKQIASTLTTPIKILGSALGREVVTTALGLPKQIALQSLPTQEKEIAKRLDPSKFTNAVFVDRFVQRYLSVLNGAGSSTGMTA